MATKSHNISDKVRMVYDDVTLEKGFQVALVAWENLSKGNIVSFIQWGTNGRVSKTPIAGNENDMAMGVVYADATTGNAVWVWINGSICQVLPEAGITATLGYILYASWTTAWTVNQSASAPATTTHFKECGHWAETGSWNGALALASIHFN